MRALTAARASSFCADTAAATALSGRAKAAKSSSARQSTSCAAGLGDRAANHGAELLQHPDVPGAEPLDVARRVLDVHEEERDDAAGKRCPGQPAAQSKS